MSLTAETASAVGDGEDGRVAHGRNTATFKATALTDVSLSRRTRPRLTAVALQSVSVNVDRQSTLSLHSLQRASLSSMMDTIVVAAPLGVHISGGTSSVDVGANKVVITGWRGDHAAGRRQRDHDQGGRHHCLGAEDHQHGDRHARDLWRAHQDQLK
jgi:hypothetical protein